MKNKKLQALIIALTSLFIVASVLLMFGPNLLGDHAKIRKTDSTLMPTATGTTNEIKKGIVVEQDFICTCNSISKIGIVFTRTAYREGITMVMKLLDEDKVLASEALDSASFEDQHRTYLEPVSALTGMKNKKLTIRIYPLTEEDSGLMIMMDKNADTSFRFGNKTIQGTLCFSVTE